DQRAVAAWQRMTVGLLQKGRDAIVERLFFVGRFKWPRDGFALGVLDVFQHVLSEGAVDKRSQAFAQLLKVCAAMHVLLAKCLGIAEQIFVDNVGKAI